MRLLKVSAYCQSLRSVIQLKELLPKTQLSRCYTKNYTYYGGFDANDLFQKRRQQTKIIDERDSLAEKLTTFKAHLAKFSDPIKKYEYLIKLRDYDIDMYYRYLCNNTAEALTVFCAIDGIQKRNMIFFKSSKLGLRRREMPIQQLDLATAVKYLQKQVDVRRQEKCSDNAKQAKFQAVQQPKSIENMDNVNRMWAKKGLMKTPEYSFMIYMKDK